MVLRSTCTFTLTSCAEKIFDINFPSSFESQLLNREPGRSTVLRFIPPIMISSTHIKKFCIVAASILYVYTGISSCAYAQIERDGYRQVNTLLSHALMDIIRDGQYHSICTYNAGFAWGEGIDADEYCSKNVVDPDSCTRKWDNSEEPAGILAKIISTGKLKWCVPEALLCPNNEDACVKNGYTGVAERDNELQGISKGDYYGITIDRMNALTIAMGKILHVPLKPKLVVIDGTDKGIFNDVTGALASNECYATGSPWHRHPYREAVVDFACPMTGSESTGFAIHALPSSGIDLEDVYNRDGEGVTVCSPGAGYTQSALAERDLPKAEVIKVDFNDFYNALCRQDCDVLVAEISLTPELFITDNGCPKEPITFGVAPPSSSGGFAGVFTHRTV